MSNRSLGALFLRHCAYASAFLFLFACVAEKLAPGSVLSYVALWHIVLVTVALQLSALLFSHPGIQKIREGQQVFLFSGGLIAVVFLALLVEETGMKGVALIGCALLLLVLSIAALQPDSSPEE